MFYYRHGLSERFTLSRMGLVLVLLAGVVLAMCLLGPACGATHAQARYGGALVVGLSGGDPDSLDPTVARSISAHRIELAICERLYEYDARLQVTPVLAAAVPVLSKDKLSYTIQLRQGIQFNDGTPFNAQAVVVTVQRYMTYPGSSRASDYAAVDSVRRRAVHGRVPPQGAGLDVPRPTRWSSRRRNWPSWATTSERIRSASARSCSTTASSATTSP